MSLAPGVIRAMHLASVPHVLGLVRGRALFAGETPLRWRRRLVVQTGTA
jgi:hypothetical protein